MFKDLSIESFRGFEKFRLSGLGRINLLVGGNNSGKTSVLEALELLGSDGDIRGFISQVSRRGEELWFEGEAGVRREAVISHLFHGHRPQTGSAFSIVGTNAVDSKQLRAALVDYKYRSKDASREEFFKINENNPPYRVFEIHLLGKKEEATVESVGITERNSLLASGPSVRFSRSESEDRRVRFVSTASLRVGDVVSLFEQIVLTPEEDRVLEALRTIESAIERIASIGPERIALGQTHSGMRGGIIVKLREVPMRIPIGSLGDGVWRLLGLALSLVNATDGLLLVDEIDTGFHFTAMEDMWKMIHETAERLKVQVFATTHSNDCWTALARVAGELELPEEAVSIQRLERGREEAVRFSPEEMIIAARREIEVR